VLVAEDSTGLLGTVQLVLKFPAGYDDPEAPNGFYPFSARASSKGTCHVVDV
jgi:hypothetical protein